MQYDIVTADTVANLIRAVRAKIGDGWAPIGGPRAVAHEWFTVGAKEYREDGCVFFQAMTKE